MLEQNKRDAIRRDFEKYMRYVLDKRLDFGLEDLVVFASSLVNFYLGSGLISPEDKEKSARYIVHLFNGGLSHKIISEDIESLTQVILEDSAIDYSILQPIFSDSN